MATVHTEYGPGRIIDRETVRGRTRCKVAGEGFEVWIDQAKLGGLDDYDEYNDSADDRDGDGEDVHDLRRRLRVEDGYGDDDPARYSNRTASWDNEDEYFGGDPSEQTRVRDLDELRDRLRVPDEMDDDDPARYSRRLAWAPLDHGNSTELPYDPDPQHEAIGTPGDDGSSTIQPIHHIDADERLRPADSVSFEPGEDDGSPGPDADLFAREGSIGKRAFLPAYVFTKHQDRIQGVLHKALGPRKGQIAFMGLKGRVLGGAYGDAIQTVDSGASQAVNWASPGGSAGGYGGMIHNSGVHLSGPEVALLAPLLRTLVPQAVSGLMDGDGGDGSEGRDYGPGEGYGDMIQASHRPSGLSDRYVDLTASVDHHDPVAQFRHDPDAYINRIGHLKDEGLNPRFAEYMDLVEADGTTRTAAWKDVRKKAMRLKREGHVTVKDMSPGTIMASVVGDHGTYDVVILKGASINGVTGSSIANWHCDCEWGKWAFRRKYTYVGRLCSHAYASYLTMQSAAMKGQPRRTKRGPADTVIVKRPSREQYLPTFTYAAGLRHADTLQNGPERITPEMVVNDTDDTHIFLDVTKDERDDTGPDDVVSDTDIVHFARLMRHCEVTEQPYPRRLVAFLSRYSGCVDDSADDTPADHEAHDADDANEYLDVLRADADRKQEKDFGSMAERVHRIQDAVGEARAHGVDADRFVAMVRRIAAPGDQNEYETSQDGNRTVYRQPGTGQGYIYDRTDGRFSPVDFTDKGSQGPEGGRYDIDNGPSYTRSTENGRDLYRTDFNNQPRGQAVDVNNRGDVRDIEYVGDGAFGGQQRFDMGGNSYSDENFQNFLKNNPGVGGQADPVPVKAAPENQKDNTNTKGNTNGNTNGNGNGNTNGNGNGNGNTNGNGGNAAAGAAGTGWKAPAGGTKGPVADGGVAGAENGNNDAIIGDTYTVQEGDTATDIAQRAYGDMNRYQEIADANDITDVDFGFKPGQEIKLNDAKGNNGVMGFDTNPAGGGADSDLTTPNAGPAAAPGITTGITSPSGNTVSTANGFATPPPQPAQRDAQKQATITSRRTAREWLRWAAEGDGTSGEAAPSADDQAAGADPATAAGTSPGAKPATNPAMTTPAAERSAPNKDDDTLDPNDPAQMAQQQQAVPGQQPADATPPTTGMGLGGATGGATGGGMGMGGMDMAGVGDMISTGVGAASDIASGIGGALPGIGNAISGIASGIGSIFSSKHDFDDWVRYAYPAGGGDDFDPETLPHVPFAGSGNPGPLEYGTSEEYADKARAKMDDVTDLGDEPLSTPMGEWQKQGSYDDDGDEDSRRRDGVGEMRGKPWKGDWQGQMAPGDDGDHGNHMKSGGLDATDDSSDIVRAFQANLGDTALGAGGGGGGRFDDIAGAAAGFLRTAGRNYSLSEQSELIREGDKGGAGNLGDLDLRGTHYEDMTTLGW
jgi:LysM repeat protein